MKTSIEKYFDYLKYSGKRIVNHHKYLSLVKGKCGIEIGGPSKVFKKDLPVYSVVSGLDGVNFSDNTVWEGVIKNGGDFSYAYGGRGRQFVADATDLSPISTGTYDFLLSSNCLEHVANPLLAMEEWRRVLKPKGVMILVLPNRSSNFDHRRPVTKFEHLLSDYANKVTEHDLTHLPEIMELHDLALDPLAGDLKAFQLRSVDNYKNRTLHHHVFDVELVSNILRHLKFNVVEQCVTKRDIFSLAVVGSN